MKFFVVLLALGTCVSQADSVTNQGIAAEQRTTNQQSLANLVSNAQLEQWLRTWQERLSLDEWKVEVRMVRAADLNPDTLGHLKWNASDHTATIKVLNPLDYELPPDQIPSDIERTVVHELVHLQLSVLPRNGSKVVEEQVVNKLTEALLRLDWGGSYAAQVSEPATPHLKRGSGSNQASRSK